MSDEVVISALEDDELREAAILAHGCQLLSAAIDYGFIEGGVEIDQDRAEEFIQVARERGLEWTEDEATQAAVRLVAEFNAGGGASA